MAVFLDDILFSHVISGENHAGECMGSTSRCFRRGKTGHKLKDCPSTIGNSRDVH